MQDALWTYKQLNGDCLVPFKFVVPESPEYPEHTHDLKLGNTLSNIRCKGVYAAYRDRVIALGVSFEKNERSRVIKAPKEEEHYIPEELMEV